MSYTLHKSFLKNSKNKFVITKNTYLINIMHQHCARVNHISVEKSLKHHVSNASLGPGKEMIRKYSTALPKVRLEFSVIYRASKVIQSIRMKHFLFLQEPSHESYLTSPKFF